MSEITDRIASLAADAGLTVPELAQVAGIPKNDFAERVASGRDVSSLEVALVAEFAGRDPLWVITGQWPTDALARAMAKYEDMDFPERAGFNKAWNALVPFLPTAVRDQAIAVLGEPQDPVAKYGCDGSKRPVSVLERRCECQCGCVGYRVYDSPRACPHGLVRQRRWPGQALKALGAFDCDGAVSD
ncbi:hypothetical protein [Ornithinimicrobium murale]|uniref:hypothetical protein n=1 Tax=Ornithinimicrobium murale TaxID=1050153 RepID=UPI000E0CFE71|nr:hypothetical protein [Ornithinimicrobium murale]